MKKEIKEKGELFNEFIQKNRKLIYVIMGLIILLLITSITVFSLMDVFRGRAIVIVEEFNRRYESIRSSMDEADSNNESEVDSENENDDVTESEYDSEIEQLLAELEPFARRTSGYAGAKAWSIIADIYSNKKEWAGAEAAWVSAAGKSVKSYLEPLAWFNAAITAEEQEKTTEAIDYYTRSINAPAGFLSAPRAQFSIGRLSESLDDKDAAITAYRAVIAGWPQDQVWTNLAHSRIIALEINL
ncbi:MAG: tetratricopeptide repeat protein [Treponema sp.]|nr:tetratricopeptide repeat protein [Treponema sp.]